MTLCQAIPNSTSLHEHTPLNNRLDFFYTHSIVTRLTSTRIQYLTIDTCGAPMLYFESTYFCSKCEILSDDVFIKLYISDGTGELECELSRGLAGQVMEGHKYVFGVTRNSDMYRIDVACLDSPRVDLKLANFDKF